MEVYLDNSSTTRVRQEVLKEVIDAFENNYGNPSSIHRMGLKIEKKIEDARKKAASLINAKPEEIYFTGGGTESNNIAIFGHVGEAAEGKNIITTVFEHPSVYNVYKSLEKKMKVNYLTTDSKGRIKIDELEKLVDDDTALLSFILVNNEIGIIQDVEKIVEMVKKKNNKTRIHVDAIQAYGKIKIDVKKVKVDSISFSSHKIHGPKGVGGLFVRQGIKLDSGIFGGGQEKGIRPGTENTPGIVGFGEACSLVRENFEEENKKLRGLRDLYARRLTEEISDMKINSPLDDEGAPHILNVSFKHVRGEVLVHFLEDRGIYVSTGSACSSRAKTENRTLDAINVGEEYKDGTIRISLGYFNTFEEVEYVVINIKESVNEIRSIIRK